MSRGEKIRTRTHLTLEWNDYDDGLWGWYLLDKDGHPVTFDPDTEHWAADPPTYARFDTEDLAYGYCKCPDEANGETSMCINRIIYGPCDHENCGGTCEAKGDCRCICHKEEA